MSHIIYRVRNSKEVRVAEAESLKGKIVGGGLTESGGGQVLQTQMAQGLMCC